MKVLTFGSTVSNICSGLSPALKILGLVFFALRAIVPIILIVVAIFDLARGMTAKSESNMSLIGSGITKKVVSAIFIFFVFTIVRAVVNITSPVSENNCTACIFNISECVAFTKTSNVGPSSSGTKPNADGSAISSKGLKIDSIKYNNSIITVSASSTNGKVLGYYFSKSNIAPHGDESNWVNKNVNKLKVAKMPGTYYVFVKDNKGNIAGGIKLLLV